MESNEEYAAAARAADRAEAAPWVDYPATPAWYPPVVGLWAAALTASAASLEGVWRAVAVLGLVGIELGFIERYRRYRGTMPAGRPPRELNRAIWTFAVSAAGIAAVVTALALAGLTWWAVGVAAVFPTLLAWWYERAYALAARRARERLG